MKRSGVRTKFFHNPKMNQQKTVQKVCSDPATVSLRWLAERLAMGHFTRVSQAIGQVGRHPTRAQRRLMRRLDRLARRTDAAPENE